MKLLLVFIILELLLYSDTSFISMEEYRAQLYKNPRGLGCHHCHGERGEGKTIAYFEEKNKKKAFGGSAINNISFDVFSKALKIKRFGMPRYFLTDGEIKALYDFLQK